MASKTIFYLIDCKKQEIYCYVDSQEAKRKEMELGILRQFKTIKPYYGTIWFAVKWKTENSCSVKIAGRYKELNSKLSNDYKMQKFVFESMDSVMGKEYVERIKEFSK